MGRVLSEATKQQMSFKARQRWLRPGFREHYKALWKKKAEQEALKGPKITTLERATYYNMLARCYKPENHNYHLYGGRGIKVCKRWRESIHNFFEDMGPRPSKLYSLDRFPKRDGNYEPGNCRWATTREQANNRRGRICVLYQGKMCFVIDLAKETGVEYTVLWRRLKQMSVEDAIASYTPKTLFTKEDILYIRKSKKEGMSHAELAKIYTAKYSRPVRTDTIQCICDLKTFKTFEGCRKA
jgi:hypothetical protein